MRKLAVCICIALCVVVFASCAKETKTGNTQNEYDSYIVDMANDGVLTAVEKEWWQGLTTKNLAADRVKVIDVGETEHSLTYKYSCIPKNGRRQVDYYSDDMVEVSFDATDGSFRSLHYHGLLLEDYFQKEDILNPYETACKIATEVAYQYINADEYSLEEEVKVIPWDEDGIELSLYSFHYVRMVDGIKTSDDLYIQITSKGDVRTLHVGDTGAYNEAELGLEELEKINKSIASKIETLYSEKWQYTYEIVDQTMAYSPEGQLTVVSLVEVTLATEDSGGYSTAVKLATVLRNSEKTDVAA